MHVCEKENAFDHHVTKGTLTSEAKRCLGTFSGLAMSMEPLQLQRLWHKGRNAKTAVTETGFGGGSSLGCTCGCC